MKAKKLKEEINFSIAERIRINRKLRGISEERMAEELGLDVMQVQKIERGEKFITFSLVVLFCKKFDIPIQSILIDYQEIFHEPPKLQNL